MKKRATMFKIRDILLVMIILVSTSIIVKGEGYSEKTDIRWYLSKRNKNRI